jgi:hypothetical protein
MTRTKNKGMPPLRHGICNRYNYALNSFKKELRSERGNMSGKEFKKFVLKEWSKLSREMKLTYCNPNIYDLGADVPSPQPKV